MIKCHLVQTQQAVGVFIIWETDAEMPLVNIQHAMGVCYLGRQNAISAYTICHGCLLFEKVICHKCIYNMPWVLFTWEGYMPLVHIQYAIGVCYLGR